MADEEDKYVYIKVRLERADYERLKDAAARDGFSNPTDYATWILVNTIRGGFREGLSGESAAKIAASIERRIMDLLNPYTGKIDEINLKLSRIIEVLEEGLQPKSQPMMDARPVAQQQGKAGRERFEQRSGALERLKSEGVLFQEDAGWIRVPEKFFSSLEKRGAVVLKIGEEYVAVDRDYWENFVNTLRSLDVADSIEAEKALQAEIGEKAGRLFRKLVRSGLAVFDEDKGMWILYLPP
ncbi:MAG: hypothetical protein F7C09_00095 [Aeropyrum sp.]|nr:hypothetical protein [Aeropyrum sp.]